MIAMLPLRAIQSWRVIEMDLMGPCVKVLANCDEQGILIRRRFPDYSHTDD